MAKIADMVWHLGDAMHRVDAEVLQWEKEGRLSKLWNKDATVWTGKDESKWLGWLDSVAWMQTQVTDITHFANQVRQDGITDVLVLGMGGSSLCPEVLAMSFGQQPGWPNLHVLDSTVPEQVKRFRDQLNLKKTVCVVASKSGTTTEPNTFCEYFWAEMQSEVGGDAGKHFVAITDPNSSLQKLAESNGFRKVFLGRPEIGGRFSALSPFGMVPAALMGIDLEAFLKQAEEMVNLCHNRPQENPGLVLGVILGLLAKEGKDKVTLITAPQIWDFGAWLEQLIAESTGKEGVGIVPVDQEEITDPHFYGSDRVFVQVRLKSESQALQDEKVAALIKQGHPVVVIDLPNVMALGAEFFRWEIATAVAGAVLGIHPFNQPNVQESKDFTAQLTTAYEKDGALPTEAPKLEDQGISVFADEENAPTVVAGDFDATLKKHFARIKKGDYVAICAYLDMREEFVKDLTRLRHLIRDRFRVATTLGFGPRFLHSTGQLHKGGANNVVVLQLTATDLQEIKIPGRKFTFGILKDAQALGDASALSMRNRRVLRIHFQNDIHRGIQRLIAVAEKE